MTTEKEYLNGYLKNEESANRHMSYALLFTAALLVVALIGYVIRVFDVSRDTRIMTVSILPIVAVLSATPMFFIKSKQLTKSWFKYYLMALFVFVISVLNVIMPKHGILGWAVCIALTAHYYNPKVCRIMYVTVIIMMFICLCLGLFYGEFDANLLSGELEEENQTIHSFLFPQTYPDTAQGRYDYLKALLDAGENRFIKIFTNYYVGRLLFVTLVFAITVFLNKRTRNLLQNEITINSENQKNKTELEVAKGIQLSTLPAEMISGKEVEIVGELKAAKEVGGDFYDYVDIDKDHVALIIGDVSGKGVPAAMFMMKTITSFRDFATSNKSPSQILNEVNASIIKGNKTSLFVTCFLAILNKKTGQLKYANAGHNPPIVGYNGHYHYLKCNPGLLLGCFEKSYLKDEELILKPGETLTLYTDGITEARNKEGAFFGEERLLNAMNKHDYTCIVEMHHTIKDEIAGFVLDAPQSDDITILTLKFQGDNYFSVEKEFSAKKENIIQMLSFIKDFSDDYNIPESFQNKFVIVGDEIFSNIIKYGYEENGGEIFVRLLFDSDKNEFVITIIDKAKPFNQLEVSNPLPGNDASKLKVGGLGLIIVKKIMDEYAYDYINGKNILVLKKRF